MLSNKGTAFPVAGAAVLAVGLSYFIASHSAGAFHNVIAPPALAQETEQPRSQWAASATGRIEPVSGELSLSSEASGRIVEVLGSNNDQVKAGDLLVRLDDSEIYAKIAAARAELTSYEKALERTRIRAPQDGTILDMIANVGEMATPSPANPMVMFGDLSSLKLRAEVEERDAAKVKVGQRVVVKSDAYPDQTFTGKVVSISQSLGSPRIASRGPRRPNVVEVVEVMVALDGNPPLLTGMRVDTFFEHPEAKSASKTDGTTTN